MIKKLHIENVGPASELDLTFSKGLNVLTGDNGVGKSFILDVVWWVLTRQWPQVVNPRLISGRMAQPAFGETGKISAILSGKSPGKEFAFQASFDRKLSAWTLPQGRPTRQGLVIYAMVDGSFSIWDPARNYWRNKGAEERHSDAFAFTPAEIWNGQRDANGDSTTCNGIVEDWIYWVIEKGEAFKMLEAAISKLSPPEEKLQIGGIQRMQDARRYGTVRMPYSTDNKDIPIVLLSSAIKRILALAYSLIWAWQEHVVASLKIGEKRTDDIILIVDEIEAHLHPKWQRTILQALRATIEALTGCKNVQFILSTHSPLVMASCEDFFSKDDSWIDIDLVDGGVRAESVEFRKRGDASKWLMSRAFDMKSARSVKAQDVLANAEELMASASPSQEQAKKMHAQLEQILPPRDSFWIRWIFFLQKRCGISL